MQLLDGTTVRTDNYLKVITEFDGPGVSRLFFFNSAAAAEALAQATEYAGCFKKPRISIWQRYAGAPTVIAGTAVQSICPNVAPAEYRRCRKCGGKGLAPVQHGAMTEVCGYCDGTGKLPLPCGPHPAKQD